MTTQRFNAIYSAALTAQRSLKSRGWIRRNELPRVSVFEHKWLCDRHPKVAKLTRSFDYADNEYVEDTGNYLLPEAAAKRLEHRHLFATTRNITPAKRPTIREIWVGARSLGCVGEEELPEGHQRSQAEQEDAAELTDLMTLTYDDPFGFERWMQDEITRRLEAAKRPAKNIVYRKAMRKLILREVPTDRQGQPTCAMLVDDESGEYRPVRIGDTLTKAHGSNEDLDALYLEEPADDRAEEDSRVREMLRDRINPNSEFETSLLDGLPGDHGTSDARALMTTFVPKHEPLRLASRGYEDNDPGADEHFHDELYLRRVANYVTEQLIARKPKLESMFAELRDHAFKRIRNAHAKLVTKTVDNGDRMTTVVTAGRWLTPKDLWDETESRLRTLERHRANQRHKIAPKAVDWDALRTPQEHLNRAEVMSDLTR